MLILSFWKGERMGTGRPVNRDMKSFNRERKRETSLMLTSVLSVDSRRGIGDEKPQVFAKMKT